MAVKIHVVIRASFRSALLYCPRSPLIWLVFNEDILLFVKYFAVENKRRVFLTVILRI